MEEKLTERKQVVDKLVSIADVTQPFEEYPKRYRVLVPGAIREENIVDAESQEEAIEKVRQVLYSKEHSRLESYERLNGKQTADGDVTISPDNLKIDITSVLKTDQENNNG